MKQHYVPKFYLRAFSVGNSGKFIRLYHLPSNRYVAAAPIRDQAYEKDFYGAGQLEGLLSINEQRASEVIRDIVRRQKVPEYLSEDHTAIALYALFQMVRTVDAAHAFEEGVSGLAKNFLQHYPKVKDYLDRITIKANGAPATLIKHAAGVFPLIWDLRFKILRSATENPFVTSDNPVALYNRFFELYRPSISGTGLANVGLLIFLPLTPRHLIVFYDPATYKVGGRSLRPVFVDIQEKDVLALNILQVANAYDHVFFPDAISLHAVQAVVARSKPYRESKRIKVREFYKGMDRTGTHRSLVVSENPNIRTGLTLKCLQVRPAARRDGFNPKVVLVRNPKLCDVYQRFDRGVEEGKYQPDEIYDFIAAEMASKDAGETQAVIV